MFLAIKEIRYEKLRYGLIIALIFLVSYLLIILTGLSSGLANLNKAAINEWGAKTIILDKDSEGRLSQSFLSAQTLKSTQGTQISQYSSLVKSDKDLKENAQIIALPKKSFVYKNLKVTQGDKFSAKNTAFVSDVFKNDGFKIGDKLQVANSNVKLSIVGFTPRATLSVSPVIYTSFETIKPINRGVISAILTLDAPGKLAKSNNTLAMSMNQFINKLPGYRAQNLTFNFMIGFLYVIIFIVISIFLYILTVQKLPNFGVLKAQGISTSYLVLNTLVQSLIMSVIGVALAIIIGAITAMIIPSEVPIMINVSNILSTSVGVIMMSLFGSIIPVRQITKVDPYTIIGG
ncbi:FtsX-like permease family protein [Leuconostoc sp. MS02]|uniref:Putative hemin transport system permease protein HrtB n=1 Tax=Leuconostoc aquikimchii TaxID=3236804 RepID=A0ABV3S2M6_9LACO